MAEPISIDAFVKKAAAAPVKAGKSTTTVGQPLSIDSFVKASATKPNVAGQESLPAKPSMLKSFTRGLLNAPAKIGATAATAMASGAALLGSKQANLETQRLLSEGAKMPYIGNVKPIQSPKEAIGVGVEAASFLPIARVPKTIATIARGKMAQGAARGALEGAGSGALMGAGSEIQEEGSTAKSVATEALKGAAIGTAGGALIGGAIPVPGMVKASRAATRAANTEHAINQVLQGEVKDIERLRKTLSSIDTEDVTTYKDLKDRANEKVQILARKLDEAHETSNEIRLLNNLDLVTTVGSQTVRQNYVRQALDQLKTFYTKTNDVAGASRISQLFKKAETQGLSVKEINEIARLHGQDLSAYNASGELASGLSKQAAENTRTGVKATVRDLFGNELSKKADAELAKLIRVRDLATEMEEKVSALSAKIPPSSIGGRVSDLIEQTTSIVSSGIVRGIFNTITKGDVKRKTLDAIGLEKVLQQNLKLIRKATAADSSEEDIIRALEQFIRNSGQKPLLMLPAPGQGSRGGGGSTLYVPPKGGATPNLQEAVDTAAVQTGRAPTPTGTPRPLDDFQRLEPYTPDTELPVIPFGKKPPKIQSTLPVIDAGKSRMPANPTYLDMQSKLPKTPAVLKKVQKFRDALSKSGEAMAKAVDAINKGGTTMDVLRNVDFGGTPNISVAPFPEKTQTFEGKATMTMLAEYMEKNIDLFTKKGRVLGGWHNADDGKTYLDVAVPVSKKKIKEATELGKISNQISIFDLEEFKEIKTGGTGEAKDLAPLEERIKLINKILGKD